MRKIKTMLVAFMAIATVSLTGCKKDPVENPANNGNNGNNATELTSLAGTSWVGIYDDTYQGYPAELTYSVDFNETDGSLMLELTVAGQQQNPDEYAFTYTYEGNVAMCTIENVGSFSMTYNPESNTLSAEIVVGVENGGTLGGAITFYPRGTDPIPHSGGNGGGGGEPGETTEDFPANTSWQAYENATYQGTPVEIEYQLYFANDYTGSLNFNIIMGGTSNPAQGFSIGWSYDENSASGYFQIQQNSIPFTYNASEESIYTSFPFGFSETETFGDSVVFKPVQKKIRLNYGY